MNRKNNIKLSVMLIIIFIVCVISFVQQISSKNLDIFEIVDKSEPFKIISSSENKDLENILQGYAKQNNIQLEITYAGTIDIMDRLNAGEEYDAVWTSNSIWLYMLNDNVSVKNSKSTSINPVVLGITKSKAKELNFIGREVYTKELVDAIKAGNLKFNMSSATRTNTGATSYLGFLTTLAGSPEVLKEEDLKSEKLQEELVSLFSGVTRSSGSEEFIEDMFLNGNYEAVITYETSLININKKLEAQGKEPLYIIYTTDGVSLSDSPFAYIDHKDKNKLEIFNQLQTYLLSNKGQEELGRTGRRVWYGGINENADKTIFNPEWGIDTTKYLVPVKYPSTEVIKKALALYQSSLRKPVHTVYCLDYSGSMYGNGNEQLVEAMEYILTQEEAQKDLLQYSNKDKITIIPFSSKIIDTWNTNNGLETASLIEKIKTQKVTGGTDIYSSSAKALEILSKEDNEKYNLSVILMTDGMSNAGRYNDLKTAYKYYNKDIPIFSIMFGNADSSQLEEIAELTNAKVFDGRTNLLAAFKEVRGYN